MHHIFSGFQPGRIIENPSEDQLREWSLAQGGIITEFGNLAVTTSVRNRIARFTEVVMGEPDRDDVLLIKGNLFLRILRENPGIRCFILNTGHVGGASRGQKITVQDSVEILEMIGRDKIEWKPDGFWGYEVPVNIPGVDLRRFDLNSYYPEEQARELSEHLKRERLEWLAGFPGLDIEIMNALKP